MLYKGTNNIHDIQWKILDKRMQIWDMDLSEMWHIKMLGLVAGP